MKLTFSNKPLSEFYPEVRRRVDEYFASRRISPHANAAMIAKTIFILLMYAGSYIAIVSNTLPPFLMLILAAVCGFFSSMIGLNIAHDAIHGSYSANPKVNRILGTLFNIVGANDYVWKVKHNIVHHTYTNVPEHDDDINQVGLLRFSPSKSLKKIHRFQYIYIFLLYPLATMSWVLAKDYVNFFRKSFGWYDNSTKPMKEIFRLFFYKLLHYAIFIVLPFILIELPWYQILIGIILMHLVAGFMISFVFQLAHLVEGTDFPEPTAEGVIEKPWAVHQMYTTADFARKSPLALFLFGGLNFQIEHHLFPKICHIHYQKIAPIVEQTALEFNLPYIDNKTFMSASRSHVRLMKKFGRQ